MIWGGDKLRQYKAIDTYQKNIGESWELSGVPGNESVILVSCTIGGCHNFILMLNTFGANQ